MIATKEWARKKHVLGYGRLWKHLDGYGAEAMMQTILEEAPSWAPRHALQECLDEMCHVARTDPKVMNNLVAVVPNTSWDWLGYNRPRPTRKDWSDYDRMRECAAREYVYEEWRKALGQAPFLRGHTVLQRLIPHIPQAVIDEIADMAAMELTTEHGAGNRPIRRTT